MLRYSLLFMKRIVLSCIFVLLVGLVWCKAQETNAPVEKRQYHTNRITTPVKLDGVPDEDLWNSVAWTGDFIQHMPDEKAAPSEQTRFKIVYDNKYLYVAYQCYDTTPQAIVRRMGRRDEFPGDWMEINIDSYHDLRTAFSFTISASGVRGDEFVSANGDNWDQNWNPIWYGKTHVDDSGWTAEIKIPFSQLRYGNEPDKVWGIQVHRRLFRKEERSIWQFIPRSSGSWVSNFGELHGLKGVPSQKQIEIAPYLSAQTEKYRKEEGNPFSKGTDSKISAGVDGKVAVTSDLILDFTVNPDFGQVEADPSQVRIDGFQNYFEEKRPFFIEGSNIFEYQLTGSMAGGGYDQDILFYSRRIGGSPHGYPSLASDEYASVPDNTSILGAAKFSGKTKKGWSIGVLESITQREKADVDHFGDRRQEVVEPLTSYFVGRLQKDLQEGRTVVGGMFTAVNRENGLNDILHKSAYTGGLDYLHYWKNRAWYYKADIILSQVHGSPEAIYNTQTAFEHLFQRSNNTEAKLDNTRTLLTGTGGTFKIGKQGGNQGKRGELLKFQTGVTWRSPQLELNDIGFMNTADEISHFTWVGLNYQKPFSAFRSASINYNHWAQWDFSGQFLFLAFNMNTHATLKNNWNVGTGIDWNPYDISNQALRGQSSIRRPAGWGQWVNLNTDSRKKIRGDFNMSNGGGFGHTVRGNNYSIGLNVQPLNSLNIGISGSYNYYFRKQDQFVQQVQYNGITRTVVGEVQQKTLRFTLRVNYNITPDLTVQYYGQPFITRPVYDHFGYVVDPLNKSYDARFHQYSASEFSYLDGTYSVDETGDGITDYTFRKPDFNFVQFRSNLVLRWEYRPGSELYLVWSQGSTPDVFSDTHSPIANSLFDNLFSEESKNIGLIKLTYRFLK
jgi:hypothetical protein